MPVVFRFGPYKFFFYSNEGDPREPVHIHVSEGRNVAKFWLKPEISPETVMANSKGFDVRALREISAIIGHNVGRIERTWPC
jgi:Domain of unknown function (DUF4160)